MLAARRQHRLYQSLSWLCDAVIFVWLALWLIALFRPDFIDASNKQTIPWLAGAWFGGRIFRHLTRQTKPTSPPPAS
jgi:hypothetical protein